MFPGHLKKHEAKEKKPTVDYKSLLMRKWHRVNAFRIYWKGKRCKGRLENELN